LVHGDLPGVPVDSKHMKPHLAGVPVRIHSVDGTGHSSACRLSDFCETLG
jgi:hypothetical protein